MNEYNTVEHLLSRKQITQTSHVHVTPDIINNTFPAVPLNSSIQNSSCSIVLQWNLRIEGHVGTSHFVLCRETVLSL